MQDLGEEEDFHKVWDIFIFSFGLSRQQSSQNIVKRAISCSSEGISSGQSYNASS